MYWYYATFTKPDDAPTCLSFATGSFQKRDLQILLSPDGFTTVGGAADFSVIVQVTCVPQGGDTWLVVTTFSDNNNVAETVQNNVRSDIQSAVRID